jgi:hypothetical protein
VRPQLLASSPRAIGFWSSPRAQRRLIWIGGGVFGVGLILILSTTVLRGTSGLHSPISNVAAQHVKEPVKAPPDHKAYKVARKFIETAVLRKHLDVAYPLVNHDIKGGMTRKQWDTGNIAVVSYPANNTKTAGFTVIASYKTQIMLLVDLVARPNAPVRPHLPFWLGLVRAGNKPNGRWLVSYWLPDWMPPIPIQ